MRNKTITTRFRPHNYFNLALTLEHLKIHNCFKTTPIVVLRLLLGC